MNLLQKKILYNCADRIISTTYPITSTNIDLCRNTILQSKSTFPRELRDMIYAECVAGVRAPQPAKLLMATRPRIGESQSELSCGMKSC